MTRNVRLECGARQVAYEIRMLARSVPIVEQLHRRIDRTPKPDDDLDYLTTDRIEANLALEGYLLHARALLEFLGARAKKKEHENDITFADFDLVAAATPLDGKRIKRLDRRLAHLTWTRCDNGGQLPGWEVKHRAVDLLLTLRTLLNQPDARPEAGALLRMADRSLVELCHRSAVPDEIRNDPEIERIFRRWTSA